MSLSVEPDALAQLLVVQSHDLTLDQLAHRQKSLPEHNQLAGLDRQLDQTAQDTAAVQAERAPLDHEQKRLDDEVTRLREKIASEDRRLYSGTVTSPRELQAIQDELASLGRRASVLEDEELEILERLDPLDARVAQLRGITDALAVERDKVAAALADATRTLQGEIDASQAAREAAVARVPAELLASYEQLRRAKGGIGAARLVGHTCQGCHLELSAVEVDRIRRQPADALLHCEECGRILVR